jgi:hypothetical protein
MLRLSIILCFFSSVLMSSEIILDRLPIENKILEDYSDLSQTKSYYTLETLYFGGNILYALYSLGYGDVSEPLI